MTNRSHRSTLRAALRDDPRAAGREALLARSFWAASAAGVDGESGALGTLVSLAEVRGLRAVAPLAASSPGAALAASRGPRRTP